MMTIGKDTTDRRRERKTRTKRRRFSFFLLLAAAALLTGCRGFGQSGMEEPKIQKLENHLSIWREELPQDTKFGGISANALRGIEIKKEGKTVFAASYEPREGKESFDYWDISVPYQSLVSVNTEELYDLFDVVAMTAWGSAGKITLEEAGISENSDSIFLAYSEESKNGEKGNPDPQKAASVLIGKEDSQGSYYAALKGSSQVGLINKMLADEILNADPYQYILKLPVLVNMDTVRKVQIISGNKSHMMEQENDSWKLDGREAKQKECHSLYGALLDVMLAGEMEADAEGNERQKPALTIQFLRNLAGVSDIEVKYYEYDEEKMSVSVNGMKRFLVEKKDVNSLQEKIDAGFPE